MPVVRFSQKIAWRSRARLVRMKSAKARAGGDISTVNGPGQADIHGRDETGKGHGLDAQTFERPGSVDHVRKDGDAHAVGHHGAHSLDRRGAHQCFRATAGLMPVALCRVGRLIDGEHDVRFLRHITELDIIPLEEMMARWDPQAARRAKQGFEVQPFLIDNVGRQQHSDIVLAPRPGRFRLPSGSFPGAAGRCADSVREKRSR